MVQPHPQKVGIHRADLIGALVVAFPMQPVFGQCLYDVVQHVFREAFFDFGFRLRQTFGRGTGSKHMVFYVSERTFGGFFPIAPGMVKIKGGAVVNEPKFLVPKEHVGVAEGTVDVGREGIRPYHF